MNRIRLGPGVLFLFPITVFSFSLGFFAARPFAYIIAFSLIAYFILSLLLSVIFFLAQKRLRPHLIYQQAGLMHYEGENLLVQSEPLIPSLSVLAQFPPLILSHRLVFQAKGTAHSARRIVLELRAHRRARERSLPLLRGLYEVQEKALVLRDVAQCLSLYMSYENNDPTSLVVAPRPWEKSARLCEVAGGDILRTGARQIQSETLDETRKYHPGDDPRKINWKLYSHSEELFIRMHEKDPPPQGSLSLYIDSTVDPDLFSDQNAALDLVARFSASFAAEAERHGLLVSYNVLSPHLANESQRDLNLALASLIPASHEARFSTSQDEYIHVVSLPHRSGLSPALRELFERGWQAQKSHIVGTHFLLPRVQPPARTSMSRFFAQNLLQRRLFSKRSPPIATLPILAETASALARSKGSRYAQIYQE